MPTLTWDDLRAIRTEVPSVRAAAAQLRTTAQVLSEDQNWTTSVTGHDARSSSRSGAGRSASGALFTAVRRGRRHQGRGAREDRRRQALRRRRRPGRPDRPHQERPVPGGRRPRAQGPVADGAGLRRRRSSSRSPPYQAKIQGGLQKYVSGAIVVGAQPGQTAPRASAQITDAPARPPPHPARRRRRLLDPEPHRDGRRAAAGRRAPSRRSSPRSPRSRSSSAASGS